MTELEQLLERVTHEPAYGPAFYRSLLNSPVYGLIPAGPVFTPTGTIRLVMWAGEDGVQIIPFFASEARARRALTTQTQAIQLPGRVFLDACRGATVVLNPNERYFCRLTAPEVDSLLATGSPNTAESFETSDDMTMDLRMPEAPAEWLGSLSLLFSQEHAVDRAYLVTCHPEADASRPLWLIAIVLSADDAEERVAHQVTALLTDAPPRHSVDLLCLTPDDPKTSAIASAVTPFYERAFGAKVIMGSQLGRQ